MGNSGAQIQRRAPKSGLVSTPYQSVGDKHRGTEERISDSQKGKQAGSLRGRRPRWEVMTSMAQAQRAPQWLCDLGRITPSLVSDVPNAYRFLPGRTRGEGFFLAVLRKGNPSSESTPSINHKKRILISGSVCREPNLSHAYEATA